MVVANSLLRGMLVGLLAAILSFAFLETVGEPAVDRAIAFETQLDEAKAKHDEAVAKGLPATRALAGIVAVYVIPNLNYPANPPSVGDPETIGMRTQLYFSMIAFSLAAMVGAWMLRNRLAARFGAWDLALIAAGAYLALMIVASLALPAVNEVPEAFPATVLWQFRMASLGAQAIMWGTIGLAFRALTERAQAGRAYVKLRAV